MDDPGNKPALLRQLFHLACAYSGQILSLRVMLVGGDGISVEAFLTMDPQQWLAA